MKTLDRRGFLKKATLAGASALTVPTLFESCTSKASASTVVATDGLESKLIVPKNNGLKITGTFLDEISHDIPHQNWGEKEWDLDFLLPNIIVLSSPKAFYSGKEHSYQY